MANGARCYKVGIGPHVARGIKLASPNDGFGGTIVKYGPNVAVLARD